MQKWLSRVFIGLFLILPFAMNDAVHAAANPFEGMLVYEEGQYKVGKDFTAGEYVLLSTTTSDGYFSISTDANGWDILANDLFETNSIITVYDGEYLQLSRCMAIRATDFYSSYTIKTQNDGTMLKVGYGYDISPGEYKLIAAQGTSGYYCIYDDSRHTDIITNDLFKNSAWVTVQSGQYIVLSRCHIHD